ncbi:MAG: hypothetical protein WDO73_07140 [Ignavibacteriota bacterium]
MVVGDETDALEVGRDRLETGSRWLRAAAQKRILNVRVPAASLTAGRPEFMNWKAILTALDKDGYPGRVTLDRGSSKDFDAARDSLDQLVHIVREVS